MIDVYIVLIWTQVVMWSIVLVDFRLFAQICHDCLKFSQNDIRGLPSTTCGRSPPSLVGGCNACCIRGVGKTDSGASAVVMPGAVMYLRLDGEHGELRKRYASYLPSTLRPSSFPQINHRWKEEFGEIPVWGALWDKPAPARRTHEEALRNGEAFVNGDIDLSVSDHHQ